MEKTIDVGDDVVVILRSVVGETATSVDREVATIWTLRNVRVRFRAFERPADALKAVGMDDG